MLINMDEARITKEQRKQNNLGLCFHGAPPPCECACPFPLDIRAFMEKLQRGNFGASYRLYRNAVVFPDIVWRLCPAPCKSACVRLNMDEALLLPLLEESSILYARSTEPTAFNLPKKESRIAVVGAGLSGLTVALKFASKKYDVTVFEKTRSLGGSLSNYLAPEIYLPEIEKQFRHETYTLMLEHKVEDIESLPFDAIYLSSGVQLSSDDPRVFRCAPGVSPIMAIVEGINAFSKMEWYLKTGGSQPQEETAQCTPMPPVADEPRMAVVPANGTSYTKEEAIEEAARCLRCDCEACMQNCTLLERYQNYPARLVDDVDVTMNPTTTFTGRVALRQISSCNLCGLCKKVCPIDVDIGDYLLRTRKELFETGALPAVYHDFWLRDMAFSNTEASLSYTPNGTAEYAFFPGCQLGGSDQRYVSGTYEKLRAIWPGTSLLLRCCGMPALWAGDEQSFQGELAAIKAQWKLLGKPVILLACPSCYSMFQKYLGEIPCKSVYEVLKEASCEHEPYAQAGLGSASVFDPCASREFTNIQSSVRELLRLRGVAVEELSLAGGNAPCCGWGGQIYSANPAYAKSIADLRVGMSALPYITYCVNCRDIFSSRGKRCLHILDIFLNINLDGRRPPTATERRHNRLALKRALINQYGIDADLPKETTTMKLIIPPELQLRMSDALILDEDITAVIAHCEGTGNKLAKAGSGTFIGHLKLGLITFWVEYAPRDDGYLVKNAYSHRMMIREDA